MWGEFCNVYNLDENRKCETTPVEKKPKTINKENNNVKKIETRGDDIEIIDSIKDYIPIERQDIWSWVCYLENQIK
ncbi:hypothetical protein [uncultured Clostridium sp.]|uniref:hypothetical protein n=1 Tax=uncultured Clostridium sp. TaxID=59620 RepID=UPI00321711B7